MKTTRTLATLVALGALAAGCGRQDTALRSQSGESGESRTASAPAQAAQAQRAELLNRIKAADPDGTTIQRALLNERNELGLILSRQTNLDDIPKLMRVMLAELDKAFPGHDQIVVAYAPTNPPRELGTARLNARTRDMTYTPATQ